MQFLHGRTNTVGGLRQLIPLPWRENALRIAIVMSDGKLAAPKDTLAALEEVHQAIQMPNLTIRSSRSFLLLHPQIAPSAILIVFRTLLASLISETSKVTKFVTHVIQFLTLTIILNFYV